MSHEPTDDRVADRASALLPEEETAGSEDPDAQAAAILAESDERQADRDEAPDADVERRTSDEVAVDPD